MAKLNLDYYDGKDIYNDGTVEEQLLEYYKNQTPLDLYQDNVFYLTTDIRSNILNWYPFSSNDNVLEIGCGCGTLTGMLSEKCGSVTCIEGSKRRAEITYYRHKSKKNLVVYAGNFNDIKIDRKFDYIILIGVFEYAKMFFLTDNPFDTFLEKIQSLLATTGKVLLAIENRYGIKYWAGANEDHLLKPYVGLEGYDNYQVQTFGKEEFIKMIQKYGFTKNKFYYPFPDYKLPTVVYTDKRLPKYNEIVDIPIYSYGNSMNFDSRKVLSGLLDNQCFGFFSNSFLIEFGGEKSKLSDIIYARNLSYRSADFKTITIENEKHEIIKIGSNESSCNHLVQLKKNHDLMKKKNIAACQINKKGNCYYVEKIEGEEVAQYISCLAKQKKWDAIWTEIDRLVDFYKSISTKKVISNPIISEILKVYHQETWVLNLSLIDGNISNIIRKENGNYVFIDQEWIDDRELPMEYLIYYSFMYIWKTCDLLQQYYSIEKVCQKYGITKNKIKLFQKIEDSYFLENNHIVDVQTRDILNGCNDSSKLQNGLFQNVLYYDLGKGFNEQDKLIGEYLKKEDKYEVTFQLPRNVSRVRFDPAITGNRFVYFGDVKINDKKIKYEVHNIKLMNNRETLCLEYPYISFPFKGSQLKITLEFEKFTEKEIRQFLQLQENDVLENESLKSEIKKLTQTVQEQQHHLDQITNSKGWRLLEKVRKIKRR